MQFNEPFFDSWPTFRFFQRNSPKAYSVKEKSVSVASSQMPDLWRLENGNEILPTLIFAVGLKPTAHIKLFKYTWTVCVSLKANHARTVLTLTKLSLKNIYLYWDQIKIFHIPGDEPKDWYQILLCFCSFT